MKGLTMELKDIWLLINGYYYIDTFEDKQFIVKTDPYSDPKIFINRLNVGNIFATKEEAENHINTDKNSF